MSSVRDKRGRTKKTEVKRSTADMMTAKRKIHASPDCAPRQRCTRSCYEELTMLNRAKGQTGFALRLGPLRCSSSTGRRRVRSCSACSSGRAAIIRTWTSQSQKYPQATSTSSTPGPSCAPRYPAHTQQERLDRQGTRVAPPGRRALPPLESGRALLPQARLL